MKNLKGIVTLLLAILFIAPIISASEQQVLVEFKEYVNQDVTFNPLKTGSGTWFDSNENQSNYNLVGYLVVSNMNPQGKTISDIYISLDYTTNITLPVLYQGRNGTFISNNPSSNQLILHIPELMSGENSTWEYSINGSNIKPVLNFTSSYSDTKLLAGENISVFDKVQNVFDNAAYQTDTCVYDINITQVTVPVNFSGNPQDFLFIPSTIAGSDSSNVTFSADNKTQSWDLLNGACLLKTNLTDINYDINTPLNIPKTTDYSMVNTTIKYKLNNTISHLRLVDIEAISEASLDFEKKIMKPSHPTLYGSNVTWNVSGYFNTNTNITYTLEYVTFWVSQRNVNGSYTDPNTVDNDSISGSSLAISSTPNILVNSTNPWASSSWLFNYSDIPSPIVWMDLNFTITNDGTQLVNRSVTQNGNDLYIKELYLILGYWLEIEKNITALSNDTYNIEINVHNKGNQVTPADTVVTIYDFIPSNYNLNGSISHFSSPWYNTATASNNVSGGYNGTLYQWGLIPTGASGLNTSFAPGPNKNENTTWSASYNVTGLGDYELMDVFVTGLDPQQVDGAGSTKSVVVSEIFDRIGSTEGIFAVVASVLLLLGLLL